MDTKLYNEFIVKETQNKCEKIYSEIAKETQDQEETKIRSPTENKTEKVWLAVKLIV